ncbi:MAG: DUF1320 domain-containing protein [Rhodobacteraceae bacterium]|nr:DUF1320 domain-containing protein [Paracoccaceae bacterium]
MAYADLTGLTARIGEETLIELSDRASPPAGVVDATVIDAALADTDALIDGYLLGRYALPLSAIPALVTTLAEAITIYKLYTFSASERAEADYRDALKTLEKISKGEIKISAAGAEPSSSGGSGVKSCDRKPEMTRDNMGSFI